MLLPSEVHDITVSVISHGHDAELPALLDDLAHTGAGWLHRVVLTHNLPAASDIRGAWPFELLQIHNAAPLGFGANHNQAFAHVRTPFFCVLNPDIRLRDAHIWARLHEAASRPGVGVVAPTLLNGDGSVQDQQRALVTPWSLFKRRVLGRSETRVDWFSAAFLLLPSAVYRALGGFDERFHMYCEDVDLCLRLQTAGHRLERVAATAVHQAQRASLRQWRPAAWHVRSLLRLWLSPGFWAYRRWRRGRPGYGPD